MRGAATPFNVRIYLYLSDDNGNLELQKVIRVARSYLTLFDYHFKKKKDEMFTFHDVNRSFIRLTNIPYWRNELCKVPGRGRERNKVKRCYKS